MTIETNKLGEDGEIKARRYLILRGYKILEHNFRCPLGEIDIIALKDNVLHFVEVKTRSSLVYGNPCEAITPTKKKKIIKAALYYIKGTSSFSYDYTFDIITVNYNTNPNISFIKDAFIDCNTYF